VKILSDCTEVLIKVCTPYDGPLRVETCWMFKKHIDLYLGGITMALGSTQPLTEMSTRNLPGGKRAASA
jgi:hypothetical protein